ncbi:hypothetical protein V8E54_013171 [Elaphomyces granulatus]
MEPTWWQDAELLDISGFPHPHDMNFAIPPAHPPAGPAPAPPGPGLAYPLPGPGFIHPPPGPSGNSEPGQLPPYPRRRCAQLACDRCRARKGKCNEGRPSCSNCMETGSKCVYQEPTPYMSQQERLKRLEDRVWGKLQQLEDRLEENLQQLNHRLDEMAQLLGQICQQLSHQ